MMQPEHSFKCPLFKYMCAWVHVFKCGRGKEIQVAVVVIYCF